MTGVILMLAVMLYFLVRIEQHLFVVRGELELERRRRDRAAMLEREGVE